MDGDKDRALARARQARLARLHAAAGGPGLLEGRPGRRRGPGRRGRRGRAGRRGPLGRPCDGPGALSRPARPGRRCRNGREDDD